MADGAAIGPGSFDSHAPASGFIEILFDDVSAADSKATEINIHVRDCSGTNRLQDLLKLTKISIPTTIGIVELELDNAAAFSNHVHFDVVPVGTGTTLRATHVTENTCSDVDFFPTVATSFRTNEYNAIFNDAQQLRRSEFIFEVDNQRSGSSVAPQNIESILAGTAVTASVQDSNYTSNRVINGRYVGTKTDTDDYGLSSALSGKLFRGALFELSTDILSILSSSATGNVNYKEYLFAIDDYYNYGVSSGDIFHVRGTPTTNSPNARYITLMYGSEDHGSLGLSNLAFANESGSLLISGARRYHERINSAVAPKFIKAFEYFGSFEVGEPFMIGTGNDAPYNQAAEPNFEFLTFLSSSLDAGPTLPQGYETSIFFETGSRNYPQKLTGFDIFSGSDNSYTALNTGSDERKDVGRRAWTSARPAIFKIISDSVYEAKGNQLAKIKDKFMLVEDTQEIMVIDQNGKIIFNMGSSLS